MGIEEQLGDLEVLESFSFELALEWVRHENSKAIAGTYRDAATILVEAEGSNCSGGVRSASLIVHRVHT